MNTAYENALEKIREAKEKGLKILDLSASYSAEDEELTEIPHEVFDLGHLEELILYGNAITVIPDVIFKLKSLMILDLYDNLLTTLPDAISRLQNLTRLNLGRNQLTTLPDAIASLQNLKQLYLFNNQFTVIPEVIYEIKSLKYLDFDNLKSSKRNRITALSPKILQLENLTTVLLKGNPIEVPPREVVDNGVAAIKNYFRQLETAGMDHLYEAKLLIVGEGGAGKTTFASKIVNQDYQLSQQEYSTEGIAVTRWDFPMDNGKPFRVNIWDFGGQEIYHATHQFFLTKRSLYTLIADSRKEDTDLYYWLNIVELLSDNSPLLIVQNEKQDRRREINEGQLRGQFPNLEKTLRTNFADNRGLKEILEEIKHQISHLPQIGAPLPKTWVKVREALEGDTRNYIDLGEYLAICQQNGFKNEKDKLQLSGYLHDLGVCLHFQDDALLKKKVILKPKWGTDAVYKVLDNKTVLDNLGRFTKHDLAQIWNEPEYAGMQDELLQLMINFKLCYMVPNTASYIAPQLLSVNQPKYEWDESDNLFLRYTYDFMPKGIVTQLIVAMHTEIADQGWVWKSGVILKKDHTLAEVVEYYDKREIHIRVSGKHKRDLLTIVAHELDRIHASYQRLKYNKLIPCNCKKCMDIQERHFYKLEKLKQFIADGQKNIQCQESYDMVEVRELIDDVINPNQFKQQSSPEFSNELQMNGFAIDARGAHVEVYPDRRHREMTQIDNSTHIASHVTNSPGAVTNVGESLSDITTTVTNTINQSSASQDVKVLITELARHISSLDPEVDPKQVEQLGDNLKSLSEEAVKTEPRRKWYALSMEGLTEAATNIGAAGKPILETLGKLTPLLPPHVSK